MRFLSLFLCSLIALSPICAQSSSFVPAELAIDAPLHVHLVDGQSSKGYVFQVTDGAGSPSTRRRGGSPPSRRGSHWKLRQWIALLGCLFRRCRNFALSAHRMGTGRRSSPTQSERGQRRVPRRVDDRARGRRRQTFSEGRVSASAGAPCRCGANPQRRSGQRAAHADA